jgi:sugar phosphate isomerase/epimerase
LATSGLAVGTLANARPSILSPSHRIEYKTGIKLSIFSKNLQWLGYEEMATEAAALGFDGIDLTVRPNGHVLPERVENDLPKAVEAIRKKGLDVYTITTAIKHSSEPFTERILKAACQSGIKNYRLGWFAYNKEQSVQRNIEQHKKTLDQLAKLNKKYNIHGDYQNHAGSYFGSTVVDLWLAIKDIDPTWIGCQYDLRHATVEGTNSWPIGLELLKDHVKTINLKDFQWTKKDGKWHEENVPLGEGMVNFDKYVPLLKTHNFSGPVCIHYEYSLGGAESGASKITIPKEKVLQAMKTDLMKAKEMLKVLE